MDGLHRAVGQSLTHEKKSLSGREFRFLRHELDLSQAGLAALLGADAQSVARWEKGSAKIPGAAERIMRAVYEEHIGGEQTISEPLHRFAELDETTEQELSFEDTDEGWRQPKRPEQDRDRSSPLAAGFRPRHCSKGGSG